MIKNSRQRSAIVEFLGTRRDHPTAETVYAAVKEEFPNISLGTVYRNLSLLAELGEIQKIATGDGPDRFDYNPLPHTHFRCRCCGGVSDLDLPIEDSFYLKAAEGFSGLIEKCSVQFIGLCPECVRNTPS